MEDDKNNIFILAYYLFTPIQHPEVEVIKHKNFLKSRDAKARIYIGPQGINGQMSIAKRDATAYMEWLRSDPLFQEIEFKIHYAKEHVFPRLTIKERRQIVALDAEVDMRLTGTKLDPSQWREMLENKDEDTLLLDVRNDYEWKVGHFEGSELPSLETFRQFPKYAKDLRSKKDPKKTKVMMYCTGGIRCELYSALLKKEGFENVYQLQGGVIQYGLNEGHRHWKGKLYVFDDRMAVPLKEGESIEPISSCSGCGDKSDVYYNCANMDCNALFLSCPKCAEKMLGCCSEICTKAPRRRPFDKEGSPKPFRRHHLCGSTSFQ